MAHRLRDTLAHHRAQLISATVHAIFLVFALGILHGPPMVARYRLPGTAHGLTQLTYYSPGSAAPAVSDLPSKNPVPVATSTSHSALTAPKPTPAQSQTAQTGTGTASDSGLGEGDIKIALMVTFPHPKPDLSALPHGTAGDIILDAVIDEHGKITNLTLLHGLNSAVDNQVIATVLQQWTYTPATRNGVPVPSEQELRFHYERS